MIEEFVIKELGARLLCPVYAEVPEKYDDRFVVVQKAESAREDHIWQAMILVQSYGPSMNDAARLNEEVKTVMPELADFDKIARVHLNSDYNFTDTASKRYRYQAVFDITHY